MKILNSFKEFEEKKIQRVWHNEEWYFSVPDIVAVLTGSKDPKAYWRQVKKREPQLVTICHGLKMRASDGKMRLTDSVNLEGSFRIIQSIPSKKAEPFKLWLAKIGKERILEEQNPDLIQERAIETYRKKGYSDEWIEDRLKGIIVRKKLTDEWKERGISSPKHFAILTNTVSTATFGIQIKKHKQVKGLKSKDNLRDNMSSLELTLNRLSEEVTTQISQQEKPVTFQENREVAKSGGEIAGDTRKAIENRLGRSVVELNSKTLNLI